jgi:ABC-2 type transport system permease protein
MKTLPHRAAPSSGEYGTPPQPSAPYLAPILAAAAGVPQWQRHIQQIAPMTAGLTIQATTGPRSLPLTPWAGLGVLAAWAATAILAGTLRVQAGDA